MKKQHILNVSLLLCLVVLAVGSASAQSTYGSIRGTVTDPAGAIVASAKVTLTNEGTTAQRSVMSSNIGDYVFTQVLPGTYTIAVEASGFKKVDRTGVILETQGQTVVNMKVEVGRVTESVVVTEELPLIETGTASEGQVIDRQKLVDLPNIGRNPFIMAKLTPNITQNGNPGYMRMQDQSGSSQISIAGGPIRGNNYLLDGVPITDMNNRAIIIASIEAVEEMKLQTNTYDAEVGRTGGGMFNVALKSGVNTYHGSLGGSLRQTDWQANAFFANKSGTPRTDQPNRTYYGSFGGPVWIPKVYKGTNRTFFWATFEGYRDTQGNAGDTAVPTLAERTGDFSNSRDKSGNLVIQYDPLMPRDANGNRTAFPNNVIPAARIDKVGQAIANTFAKPGRSAAFGDLNIGYAAILPSKADQKTYKVDHKIKEWWQVNASHLRYHSLEPGENWFPTSPSSPEQWLLLRNVDATQVNSMLTINPTTVAAIRYGFNRFPNYSYQRSQYYNLATLGFGSNLVSSIPQPTFPIVNFQNYYPGDQMGAGGNNSIYVPYSRQLVGNVSKFMGRHSLKAGADWRSISDAGQDYGDLAFTFNDQFTRQNATRSGGGSDIASLLLGYPSAASAFRSTKLFENIVYTSMFVHDDIRINSRLTVNAGLRWEHETGLKERNGKMIVGFDPNAQNSLTSKLAAAVPVRGAVEFQGLGGYPNSTGNYTYNKLSPRLGVAYRVNDKTTVRGGWGIFWAPSVSFSAPYSPEGATASTQAVTTTDGGVTPLTQLANPFPNGLSLPVGTGNGDATCLGISCTIFDRNAKGTYIQQFSFDVQRELPYKIALSLAYVGSRSSRLMLGTADLNINQLDPKYMAMGTAALAQSVANPYYYAGGPGLLGNKTVTQAQLLRPFPAFGNINIRYSDQNLAQYDSFVLRAQKRFSGGLTFLNVYTWSKNLDRTSGGTGSDINRGSTGPQNVYDLPSEWALSIADATHRLSMTGIYDLPFGRGKMFLNTSNRAANLAIGGWSLNVVSVIQSGYPVVIKNNTNNNSNYLFSASQRPFATGVSPETSGSIGDRLNGWLNPAAFTAAPALTFGNVSRTISTRGPGLFNWDISLFKNFDIHESFKAQFRCEALNAFNTPYFRSPNGAVGSSSFGKVTTQGNFPRFLQLALRLYF